MKKIMITIAFLISIILISGCSRLEEKGLSNITESEIDKCDIGVNIIRESELSNFNCEQKVGCEWKILGGKRVTAYACCPKDKNELTKTTDGKGVYQRCFMAN